MSDWLTAEERMAKARGDLRIGAPVALYDAARDSGAVALAAEPASDDKLARLRALGPVDLVLSARRAETLRATAYDGDIARVAVRPDADAQWARDVADPARDLATPMKGPFECRRGGDASLHRMAINLAKGARLLPAALVVPLPSAAAAKELAAADRLTALSAQDVKEAGAAAIRLVPVASARVPLSFSEAGRVHVFRPSDGGEEHYAVEIGAPSRAEPVLTRLHSACFTGDLFESLKCDCGPQLHAALGQIAEAGAGVLLYLNQEGRGIGHANKMRAYSLQDQGFDTVEANHRLGFEDDERDFRIGAEILKALGFSSARLMTNNPKKVAGLGSCGVEVVERVPLAVGVNPHNVEYLRTKSTKSGHLL